MDVIIRHRMMPRNAHSHDRENEVGNELERIGPTNMMRVVPRQVDRME
jgi:hypothetical protein